MIRERDIQRGILDLLRAEGFTCWRQQTQAVIRGGGKEGLRFCVNENAGCPDIIGCNKDGTMFAIEVKRPNGKLSALQKAFIGALIASGAVAFVAFSVQDVISKLPILRCDGEFKNVSFRISFLFGICAVVRVDDRRLVRDRSRPKATHRGRRQTGPA